jgi:hypothetical protein
MRVAARFRGRKDMMNAESFPAARDGEAAAVADIRAEIAWICQLVRFAAIAFALWALYAIGSFFGSVESIDRFYGRMLDRDLTHVEVWQLASAFSATFVVWLFTASACYCAWRLFTNYHAGEIFTIDSAAWLRRLALLGVVAQSLDLLARPLISVLLTLHFPAGEKLRIVNIFVQPTDMAILLLLFGLLALAHIQKTAAGIAGENAQFV